MEYVDLVMLWFINTFAVLVFCTYQDYKDKMLVDDRFNFYMYGITSILISFSPLLKSKWYMIFISLGINLILYFILSRMGTGTADINALSYIFLALFFMNWFWCLLFFGIYFSARILYILTARKIAKKKIDRLPGFIVILLSFILFIALKILGVLI